MQKVTLSKITPYIAILAVIAFFSISFLRGSLLLKKSEKEIDIKKQVEEAQAKKYSLKEIDAKTGQTRWQLVAKEGKTENNLQTAIIKDIEAEVYKNNEIVFLLKAPFAKANGTTKEISLFGDVTAKNKSESFLLSAKQVALGMGTSIEAQKGFSLILKGNGTVTGDSALINDDQTEITVKDLKEASFKEILLSGKKVYIEKDKNGDLKNAIISNGGKIILKNQNNDSLIADTIKWQQNGEVEAISNVVYNSGDKVFKAGQLTLKPDKTVYAKNNVQIKHGKTQCFGNSLSYENNSLVVINGKPKAIQNDKQITADKIVYDLNTGKVQAIGNVRTTVANKV